MRHVFLVLAVSLILALLAVAAVAMAVFGSWRGGGTSSPPQPAIIVRLGCRDHPEMVQSEALALLSRDLSLYPAARFFEVRWVNSWLFGWDEGNQWCMSYDRQDHELKYYQPGWGTFQDWKFVPEDLVQTLAVAGFDEEVLRHARAENYAP